MAGTPLAELISTVSISRTLCVLRKSIHTDQLEPHVVAGGKHHVVIAEWVRYSEAFAGPLLFRSWVIDKTDSLILVPPLEAATAPIDPRDFLEESDIIDHWPPHRRFGEKSPHAPTRRI